MAKPKSSHARMLDARFTFACVGDIRSDGSTPHFAVRLYPKDGKLGIAWDVHGADGGIAEGLPEALIATVAHAIETVRSRVKIEELHEQGGE